MHIERLNREIEHLRAAVDGRVSKEFLEVRDQLSDLDAHKRSAATMQRLLDERATEVASVTHKWQAAMMESARLPSMTIELREKTASLASASAELNRTRDTIGRLQDEAARSAQVHTTKTCSALHVPVVIISSSSS